MAVRNKRLELIVSKHLLIEVSKCRVTILNQKDRVVVVILIETHIFGRLKASSSDLNMYLSFIKALSELGENIIREQHSLENRDGLAGGILPSGAKKRGRWELVERDAFIFHYRSSVPFKMLKDDPENNIQLFELSCSIKDVRCVVAFDSSVKYSDRVIFGIKTNKEISKAIEGAINELSSMLLIHEMDKSELVEKRESRKVERPLDHHYLALFDSRNLRILNSLKLNQSRAYRLPDRRKESINFKFQKFSSPVRFLSFYQAKTDEIESISFGVPEPGTKDLYLPFW
ncbi:MAG: hypothetical protein AB8E15_13725 [Bdellovibrionales bacterium]